MSSQPGTATRSADQESAAVRSSELTLEDVSLMEREVISRALERSRWKIYGEDGAAALLNIKPTTLAYRMKKMGIQKP